MLVDDLICSGNSAADTVLAVRAFTQEKAKLERIFLYDDGAELMGPGDRSRSSFFSFESVLRKAQERWDAGEHIGHIGV